MANTAGFFGFRRWGVASGPPNFAFNSNPPYRIAAGYATAIFFGDAVRMNTTGPSGFIEQWTHGDGATAAKILAGIFVGCQYFSTGQQKTVWNRYWPGSDATGDVTAYVVDDPAAQWVVQANAGPINYTSIGATADIPSAAPTGNTTTGISGMSLDTPTTTNTFPFKVMNLITTPPTANGSDITTANNYVVVSFNNLLGRSLFGV
jgi:hypothetical protein